MKILKNIQIALVLCLIITSCTNNDDVLVQKETVGISKVTEEDFINMDKKYKSFLVNNPKSLKIDINTKNSTLSRIPIDEDLFNTLNIVGSYALGQEFNIAYNLLFTGNAKRPGTILTEIKLISDDLIQQIQEVTVRNDASHARSLLFEADMALIRNENILARDKAREALARLSSKESFIYAPTEVMIGLSLLDVCAAKLSNSATTLAERNKNYTEAKDYHRKFYATFYNIYKDMGRNDLDAYRKMINNFEQLGLSIQVVHGSLSKNARLWTRNSANQPRTFIQNSIIENVGISHDGYLLTPDYSTYSQIRWLGTQRFTILNNGRYNSISNHKWMGTSLFFVPHTVNWNWNIQTVHGTNINYNYPTIKQPHNPNFLWTLCPVDDNEYIITAKNGQSWNKGVGSVPGLIGLAKIEPWKEIQYDNLMTFKMY